MKTAETSTTLAPPTIGIFILKISLCLLMTASFMIEESKIAYGAHGLSIDGKLKYKEGFERFDYTSKDAVKGGQLVLQDIGTFDKMNPYTLKGSAPLGLDPLVFETLAVSSLDEPFAKYGLIAKDITLAEDRLSMDIILDDAAVFSDGSPVTSADVVFSLEIMKSDKVHPLYADYYQDIKGAEIFDAHKLRLIFSRVNRELPMIALDIPVLSKKFFSENKFGGEGKLVAPLGTGPYVVEKINQGKTIRYKRNENYWAKDKNVNMGKYNFDVITVKYYTDQTVGVEAFKAGEVDVQFVNIAKQWARDMTGHQFESGIIQKKVFAHHNNAGMQGFVFNTRKPLFNDSRVREALGLAFDFEWTNKALFYNQYTRSNSFFSNSHLAANDVPSDLELNYLEEFKNILPKRVFTNPPASPVNPETDDIRKNIWQAKMLLEQAGWRVQDGQLKNSAGKGFSFEILLVTPSFTRVMAPYVKNLKKLGIEANYRLIDQALYEERVQNFDFDMIVHVFGQSQSPGNEQRNFWHSETADIKGSGNVAGIRSPAVDSLVEKIIYAHTQTELTALCKALDRVLWYGFYVIPNWYVGGHRLVYYNKFGMPDTLPLYYNYLQLIHTWWIRDNTEN